MRASDHVEKLILSANRVAKQDAMARRLTDLECQLRRAIAANSFGPSLASRHEVWKDLNAALDHVRSAIVTVATERI